VHWVQGVLRVTPRTGYFGPLTRDAVRRFQAAKNLKVTGKVTASTMRTSSTSRAWPPRQPGDDEHAGGSHPQCRRHDGARRDLPVRRDRPRSFDCSGYVGQVVRTATGKRLPRTSYQMRAALPRLAHPASGPATWSSCTAAAAVG
jgi:cell wall-associated NlpC family hydrolase